MRRSTYLGIALACLIALPALAEDNHNAGNGGNAGLGFSRPDLVKSQVSAGPVAVELYAAQRVDVGSLVADLDLAKPLNVQAIADRVNEKRLALYPDEEIILSLTPPPAKSLAVPGEKTALVKALFWWNNNNTCSTCYWYAQYQSTTATMFIDNVRNGSYNVYDRSGSSDWIFRYLVRPGGAATRATYGSKTLRGFKGAVTQSSSATADVIMYFFN